MTAGYARPSARPRRGAPSARWWSAPTSGRRTPPAARGPPRRTAGPPANSAHAGSCPSSEPGVRAGKPQPPQRIRGWFHPASARAPAHRQWRQSACLPHPPAAAASARYSSQPRAPAPPRTVLCGSCGKNAQARPVIVRRSPGSATQPAWGARAAHTFWGAVWCVDYRGVLNRRRWDGSAHLP